jgi:hypothetical protein
MSNFKHLPKSLPKENPFFDLEETIGQLTKEPYSGRFECKIPNQRIQANIAKYKAFLNGGMDATLDSATKNLHHMTAYCKFCLVECPDWFKDSDYGYDLYDNNILEAVYHEILKKEQNWLDGIWGKEEESGDEQKGE